MSELSKDWVLAAAAESGLALAGVAGVEPSATLAAFPEWIASGRAGEMGYLAKTGDTGRYLRSAVQEAWPWARSVLCAGVNYDAGRQRSNAFAGDNERGWISSYAWGADYHEVLRSRLDAWVQRIRGFEGAADAQFHLTVDTAPLVEREAARQGGIGWQGKNTCIIHPHRGSFLFLGCVVTSLVVAQDNPLPDRCGTCRRCIEACPTQALEPYKMDASRCLAYLNIELRGAVPEPFRAAMGNNLVGCDICQEVCPWNGRAPSANDPAFEPQPGMFAPLLAELAALTEAEYRAQFRHSAVRRIKYAGMKRNLAIAMGNSGNPEFIPVLQGWMTDPDAMVAEHATWGIKRLAGGEDSDSHCTSGDHCGHAGGRVDAAQQFGAMDPRAAASTSGKHGIPGARNPSALRGAALGPAPRKDGGHGFSA
ncbi:MAG TPA: tRNA epoxyqueuosine(34) reductase QueG [Terriglobales bacterium]|nr:tRNA epoxyqueuosine(34) reductase QueG [Terriglobales bacterium]